jgi:hypothetical protein
MRFDARPAKTPGSPSNRIHKVTLHEHHRFTAWKLAKMVRRRLTRD